MGPAHRFCPWPQLHRKDEVGTLQALLEYAFGKCNRFHVKPVFLWGGDYLPGKHVEICFCIVRVCACVKRCQAIQDRQVYFGLCCVHRLPLASEKCTGHSWRSQCKRRDGAQSAFKIHTLHSSTTRRARYFAKELESPRPSHHHKSSCLLRCSPRASDGQVAKSSANSQLWCELTCMKDREK